MRIFITFCLLFLMLVPVFAAEVLVSVDREEVEQNETFNIVFTFKGKLEGEPNFDVLEKNFEIVSQNRRSNLQVVNNQYNFELSWVLTVSPKRAGKLEIPPVVFDKETSEALIITVTEGAPQSSTDLGDIFLEAELTPETGYVQSQYLFTVRIFYRGSLVDGDLSEPDVGAQDVVIQALGEPKRYAKFRNGDRYQVYERRHALFPQASGELQISPTYFSGRLRLQSGRNMLKRVTIAGITRTVKPSPDSYTGAIWLPAQNIELVETWPTDSVEVEQGVPITRTFTVNATGLSSAQLPHLNLPTSDAVRTYPDQPSSADRLVDVGIMGVRTESYALVPQSSGTVTLPAVELVWWDTVNDRQQVARVPERVLTVAPSSLVRTEPAQLTTANVADGPVAYTALGNPWIWATALCALGWLFTLYRRSGETPRVSSKTIYDDAPTKTRRRLRAELRNACLNNEAARCFDLFGDYARHIADHPTRLNAMQVEQYFGAKIAAQVNQLSRTLYGPEEGAHWEQGKALWQLIEKMPSSIDSSAPDSGLLQPL